MSAESIPLFKGPSCKEQTVCVALTVGAFGAMGAALGALVASTTGVGIVALPILFGVGLGAIGAEIHILHPFTKNLTSCQSGAIFIAVALITVAIMLVVGVALGLLSIPLALTLGGATCLCLALKICEEESSKPKVQKHS